MGLIRPAAGAPLAIALILALVAPADAARRGKTRFDGIRDCERTGNAQFLRHDPNFRHFAIDRANVRVDRYADRAGSLFIQSIYHGKASYVSASGTRGTRFICLHSGMSRRAVFVYTLPE